MKKNIKGDPNNYINTGELKARLPKGYDFSCLQKYRMNGSRKTFYLISDVDALLSTIKSEEDIIKDRLEQPDTTVSIPELTLVAYVDGSYNKATKVYGSGIVLLCDNEIIAKKSVSGTKMNEMWNVAGEIAAASIAVKLAEEYMPDHLIIRYDCEAVEMWPTGKWRAKNEYAEKYINYMNKKRDFDISYEHVKAHSGDKYNEMADDLALEAAGIVKMENTVTEYNGEYEKLADSILTIKYQVSKTCLDKINEFYSKEKHAFKDFAALRLGQSDNFSRMWNETDFCDVLPKEAIKYINTALTEKKDRINALRWTARGLRPDDAVRKTNVDKELFENKQ